MNLLQLYYFQTVAKYEHLSKAADELHIAQPYLTRIIHSLENELGVSLFARHGRGIVLTQYGQTWLKYVNRIFDTLYAGKEKLHAMKDREATTILLSFRSAAMFAADIVSEITTLSSKIKITLTNSSQNHLSVGCSWRKDGEKNQIQLLHEVLQIALPPEHRLEKKEFLAIEDINSLEFILPTPDNPIYDVIYHYLDILNININIMMHVQNPDLLCLLVKEKSRAAFIPTLTWKKFHVNNVTMHNIENFTMDKYIYLTYREQDKDNSAVDTCRKVIVKYFQKVQEDLSNDSYL